LSRLFTEYDCSLVEINPLVVTQEGGLLALDAKISVDDDALFRHPELQDLRDPEQEDPYETKAAQAGISYVKLGGDVGCLVNGAGLAMATMDVINKAGFEPANFLDVGGGAAEEKVAEACRIMLSDPNVNRVLVNIFGGILRCDIAARGIVMAFTQAKSELPVSVRMRGTNVEEGLAILKNSRLNVTFADSLAEVGSTLRGS
jgi:succinyl-CoA synthetase beta subunit